MADTLKSWRKAGGLLGFIADALTLAGQNWGVLLSAAVALGAGFWKTAYGVLSDPHIQLVGNVFVWALWTYIGLSFLYRIHTGIKTQPYVDYAFGVIIESMNMAIDQTDDGNFQPQVNFRNVVNGAIKLRVTEVRSVIDGRTNPDTPFSAIVVPRLAQKGVTAGLFKKQDFLNKGKIEGHLDITIEYGPHDGDPVRKLRMKSKLIIQTPATGQSQWGFANEHISEEDTPI